MSIQRYRVQPWDSYSLNVAPVNDGEWVKHADHMAEVERLSADLAAARAERDEAQAVADHHAAWRLVSERQRDDARGGLLYILETQGPLYGVGWDRVLPADYLAQVNAARRNAALPATPEQEETE